MVSFSYLALKLSSVGVGSFEFSGNILLKFLHVEQLDRFVQLQGAVRDLDNLVRDCVLTVRDFHEHVSLCNPFDQDVAAIVHLNLTTLINVKVLFEV